MRITAGLAFIVTAVTSVMALKEAPTNLQIGKTISFFFFDLFVNYFYRYPQGSSCRAVSC